MISHILGITDKILKNPTFQVNTLLRESGIHYRATDLFSNRCLDRFGRRTEIWDLLCLCMLGVVGTAIPSLSKPNISE